MCIHGFKAGFLLKFLLSGILQGIQGFSISAVGSGTWDEAYKNCSSQKYVLPAPQQIWDTDTIGDRMTLRNKKSIWLALAKNKTETFKWSSGKPADEEFSRESWTKDMNCGFLNLRDATIEAGRCGRPTLGYICEARGDCKDYKVNCREINGKSFIKMCNADNWFDARLRCRNMNLQLAVMDSVGAMEILRDTWYRDQCNELWIGLGREEWVYYTGEEASIVTKSAWGQNEPSNAGNCAVISKREGDKAFKWFAEDCKAVQSWFCLSANQMIPTKADPEISTSDALYTYTATSTKNETAPPMMSNKGVVMVMAICIPVGVILLAIITCVIYFRKSLCDVQKRKTEQELEDISKTSGTDQLNASTQKEQEVDAGNEASCKDQLLSGNGSAKTEEVTEVDNKTFGANQPTQTNSPSPSDPSGGQKKKRPAPPPPTEKQTDEQMPLIVESTAGGETQSQALSKTAEQQVQTKTSGNQSWISETKKMFRGKSNKFSMARRERGQVETRQKSGKKHCT